MKNVVNGNLYMSDLLANFHIGSIQN